MTETPTPEISIVVSAWNDARWLRDFMDSVLQQDCEKFELLIVDDASTDDTYDILASYRDSRIRLFRNERRHYWTTAINELGAKSRGRLIKLMCPDDLLKKDCLSQLLDFYESHPGVGYIFSGIETIDENRRLVSKPWPHDLASIIDTATADRLFMEVGCLAATSAMAVPRARWLEIGGIRDVTVHNPMRRPNCEDFDLAVRLHDTHPAGFIKSPIVQIRSHSRQVSQTLSGFDLTVEANLKILQHVAQRIDGAVPDVSKLAYQTVIGKGAGYINLGLHYVLKGQIRAGLKILRAVLRALPVTAVTFAWLRRILGHSLPRALAGRR